MKRSWLFIAFLSVIVVGVSAQSQKQLIKVGDQLFLEGDYYGASKWYRDAMDLDSAYLDVVYKYAESLRLYNDYAKAEWYYNTIYRKDMGKLYPLAPFWYSTMLKYNGEYNEAKKFFKRSKRFFKDKKSYHYQKVEQEIKSCEKAIQLRKDSLPIDVKNIGNSINTYNSELGATLLNDSSLIYSSLRDEKMKDNNEVTDTSYYLVKLFKASKHGDIWLTDNKLDEIINENGFHVANGCINTKGNVFYYNKCDRNLHCNIFAIPFNNNSWGTPFEVTTVNHATATTSQPFLTEINGKEVMFFSSDREGGEGMMDIWYSFNENGAFQKPTNVGKVVNSVEDELTPFYEVKDSLLYFSSNWHEGLGGFDIFSTKTDLKKYQPIKNLGYPINTSTNDFYYSIKNNTALLTSNRKGSYTKKGETCCNDVYYYEIPDTTIKNTFTTLEELNRYLPVKLYFHNDHPNPRSRDTLTTLNYVTTYKEYTKLYNEYKKEFSKGLKGVEKEDALVDIEDLFSSYIDKGGKDLEMFTPLLLKELEDGKQVTLTIKGFASPLSKSDYNVNLTLRRISSLINYLSEYENGKILPYINKTAENGGELNFVKVPFGEYQSKVISDDLADKRNSVYSPGAALERKIEIIAIASTDTNNVALDGSELEKLPLLTFKDTVLTFEANELEKKFNIINNGEVPLKLFAAEFSVEGFEVMFPTEAINIFEPTSISIKRINTTLIGSFSVTFLTNTIPNRITKEIVIK